MKNFLTFLTLLFPLVLLAGGQHPPSPKGGSVPPGLPVDQYLIILFGIAVILFVVFRNKLKFSK